VPDAAATYKILQYDYVPDIIEKRGPFREGHLAAARALEEQGKCVIAGAVGDPVVGGMLVFKNTSEEVRLASSMLGTSTLPVRRAVDNGTQA
jgi:hypothetical protein